MTTMHERLEMYDANIPFETAGQTNAERLQQVLPALEFLHDYSQIVDYQEPSDNVAITIAPYYMSKFDKQDASHTGYWKLMAVNEPIVYIHSFLDEHGVQVRLLSTIAPKGDAETVVNTETAARSLQRLEAIAPRIMQAREAVQAERRAHKGLGRLFARVTHGNK